MASTRSRGALDKKSTKTTDKEKKSMAEIPATTRTRAGRQAKVEVLKPVQDENKPVPSGRSSNPKSTRTRRIVAEVTPVEPPAKETRRTKRVTAEEDKPVTTEPLPVPVKRRGRPPKKVVCTTNEEEKAQPEPIVAPGTMESAIQPRRKAAAPPTTVTRKRPKGSKAEEVPAPAPPQEPKYDSPVAINPPEKSPMESQPPSSSLQKSTTTVIAIEKSTIATPAISSKPEQVPLHRSPIYSINLEKDKPVSAIRSPPADQPIRTILDHEFGLMPLKSQTKRIKRNTKPATTSQDVDDIYGFEFNESQEPPTANKKVTKPKQPRAKKKKLEAPKFWDDKNFQQRQKQIRVNVINRDFKPKEKPIPPPLTVQRPKPAHPLARKPALNSTSTLFAPPQEIHIIDIPTDASMDTRVTELTGSRSIPWRYSSIKRSSMANVTMSSLNDSNAENVIPTSAKKAVSRPLHTLQPQRSPMKELNPNETILVPRPRLSPMKRVFGVENNFGFESDEEDLADEEHIAAKRRKIDEKINSLKKFRHSLNLGNSSSPLGPIRLPRPAAPAKATPAAKLTRNIFTSTPQQMTIRDAFQASTPITAAPGPSRQPVADEAPPKLFESLTFEQPPKRNYSLVAPRRKKRVDFLGCSDDDVSEDEEPERSIDEETFSPKRKQARKPRVNKVHEEKLAKFVDEFNSMCDEVAQYELIIE